jgi:dihydroorotase-like cyclic amidohydrolase
LKLLLENAYIIDPDNDDVKLGCLSIKDGKISGVSFEKNNFNLKEYDKIINCDEKY